MIRSPKQPVALVEKAVILGFACVTWLAFTPLAADAEGKAVSGKIANTGRAKTMPHGKSVPHRTNQSANSLHKQISEIRDLEAKILQSQEHELAVRHEPPPQPKPTPYSYP